MDLLGIASWPDRIEALVDRIGKPLQVGKVIAQCESTQDLARAMGTGSLVVAGRQTAGRGQRGNRWADTGGEGLAFSLALPATDQPRCSLALAEALVATLPPDVHAVVKPPNDVLVDGRKLAGVLVEQRDDPREANNLWPCSYEGNDLELFGHGIFPWLAHASNTAGSPATSARMVGSFSRSCSIPCTARRSVLCE